MAQIYESAPDTYRLSIYVPEFDLVRDAVSRLIDPASLRWISWSHFEVDECGALNECLSARSRAWVDRDAVGCYRLQPNDGDRPQAHGTTASAITQRMKLLRYP